jgi:molybdopterin-guanine dinucleotide biosynthesis protein A
LDRTAIILAGGFSSRFGQDKGLLLLGKRPLIKHVLDAVNPVVQEKIVVTSSDAQAKKYRIAVGSETNILVDTGESRGPLIGALTGFKETHGEYALLLPCDTPFVSKNVVSLLFELCIDRSAVIPRWPNGYIEPLQAVYEVKSALNAASMAVNDRELRMQSMIDRLRGVRYISTLVLQQLDPELKTFLNVNRPLDLRKAESVIRKTEL